MLASKTKEIVRFIQHETDDVLFGDNYLVDTYSDLDLKIALVELAREVEL